MPSMVGKFSFIGSSASRNCSHWTNTHRGTSRPTIVKGVVTQSHGIFHFTGLLSEHSTLQAMSVSKGSSGWDQFSGIVLTQPKFSPIGSRVVLRRTALSTADALGKCVEVPMQAALDLGLSDALLLTTAATMTAFCSPNRIFKLQGDAGRVGRTGTGARLPLNR